MQRKRTIARIAALGMLATALVLAALPRTVVTGAQKDAPQASVQVNIDGPAFKMLSEYAFFRGKDAAHTPNEGVVPYDIITPLFSDYTAKYRFLWLPKGAAAAYHDTEVFDFPVGTVLIKSFAYPHDFRDASKGELMLETRLLVHKASGWEGLVYVWNEEQTDAQLKVAGGTIDVEWIHSDGSTRTNNYIIPNVNECKACHENADILAPIGPKARNLNMEYTYSHGTQNQLEFWEEVGYLSGGPQSSDDAPKHAVWDDPATGSVNERARAWLEINCMHCHNPIGTGSNTGLDFRYWKNDAVSLGIMKPPVAAGLGAGDRQYDVVPGEPDESILLYRLESINPGVMMPELPRRLVDEEGVALIRSWIEWLGHNTPPAQ